MPNIFAKQSATPPKWILPILHKYERHPVEEAQFIKLYRRRRYGFQKIKALESFYPLVKAIAKHFTTDSDLKERLFIIGFNGLEEAAKKYPLEKNYRFSSYAPWWIVTDIKLYLKTLKKGN